MDHGSKIMDHGSRILDLGPCSGMNDHPGRDTDVRSRPSESTIIDLSFYIGFTRIGSSIKHLGPCFGMNGHFRRDPDVISRLPDTTIDFLSVFIGFRSSNRVKIVIFSAAKPRSRHRASSKIEAQRGSGHLPGGVLEGSGRLLGGSWLQEASWVFCRLLSGSSWAAQEPSWGPRWTQVEGQDGSKILPRRPKMSLRCLQDCPRSDFQSKSKEK